MPLRERGAETTPPVHEETSSQRNGIEPLAVLAELCPAARGPYHVSSEGQLELSYGLYNLSGASEGVLLRDQPGHFRHARYIVTFQGETLGLPPFSRMRKAMSTADGRIHLGLQERGIGVTVCSSAQTSCTGRVRIRMQTR